MGAQDDSRQWPAVREAQGRSLLPARSGDALEPRARAARRLPRRPRSLDLRPPTGIEDPQYPLHTGDELVVWTTTPWTLVSNAAVAVDPELTYVRAIPAGDDHVYVAGRGSGRGGAWRGRSDPRPVPRQGVGGRGLRSAVPVHPRECVRAEGPYRLARRLRQRHRRHRLGSYRDRVRRGRLPPRGAVRPERDQPGAARRHLRRAHRPVRRSECQGRRPRPDRGPPLAESDPQGRDAGARVSPLLALRHATALLRQAVLVHRHEPGQGPPARRQRNRQLGARARQARALRQLARAQRRLGPLTRALLGHAAPRVALQTRPHPRGRVARRAQRAGGHERDRSAPPVRRRPHVRVPKLRRGDAARARGDRRVVRLGLDAVRPVPRPARRHRAVRGALPGRLHLRGARPDARLVLLIDRGLDAAVRPLAVPERGLPRPDPRRRRPQDVQVARQHGGAERGTRPVRRRRAAVVLLHLQAAMGRLPLLDGHDRRGRQAVPAPAVEYLRLLRPVRQRERDRPLPRLARP